MAELIQVPADRDRIALEFGRHAVSYGELSARIAVLARELIGVGVGPETAVAVCMDRSVEMVVGIHGVVAAGGQYVPIDPELPADRVRYMFDTADVRVVLIENGASPGALTDLPADVLVLTVDADVPVDVSTPPVTDLERTTPLTPDNAAYTLFTSGSTGRPKGVTVSHRSLVNLLEWFDGVVGDVADPVIMLKTPYTFDVSIVEFFWPMVRGAKVVIAEPGGHRDPFYLRDLIRDAGVSIVQFVPSMLSVFLDEAADAESLASVQRMHIAGEALTAAVANKFFDVVPHAEAFNHYGPTEDTVYATTAVLRAGDGHVGIGEPAVNTTTYILDRRLKVVPAGVPGELYLGGVQVARGYAGQPGLTAERFVPDPFAEDAGARLYRTGDLVRWTVDGEIEYLGRTDFQVKLRGQRIELGDVEAVLAAAPGVVKTAATVLASPGGGEHLVAYLSPASIDVEAVKASVTESLPSYMVPSVWTVLNDIALNSAGKVDRRVLPAPDFGALAGEYVAPETDDEAALAEVFAAVLGAERIGVTDSFFDVGGNSLSAMRLAARTAETLGVAVSVRDVFEAPTVRGLLAAVAHNAPARAAIVAVDPRPHRVPLSFAQQRMWFINQLDPESATYNIPTVLRLTGPLDVAALRAAVTDVIGRHEVLRTTFPADSGVGYQEISPASEIPAALDFQVVTSAAGIEAAVGTGFALGVDFPIRVRVWQSSPEEHIVAVVMHHIASDGESMAPFITDLITAYLARTQGLAPEFVPLPVQFADYALWQHRELGDPADPDSVVGKQLAYWAEHLVGLPDVIDLPTARPRPPVATGIGAQHVFEVPAAVGARIAEIARETDSTRFMVVHAALAVLLSRLSAGADIAIGTPVAGRGDAVLDPLVGMFVNTLVLRTSIDGGQSFTEVLEAVKRTDLDAFANADVPFETVVDAVDPTRSEAFAPLSQVWLTFDQSSLPELAGESLTGGEVAGVTVRPMVDAEAVPARVDLLVALAPADEGAWIGSLVYATDLYDAPAAAKFVDRLLRVLDGLIAEPATAVGDVAVDEAVNVAALIKPASGVAEPEPASVAAVAVSEEMAPEIATGGPGTEPVLLADLFADAARLHGKRQAVTDDSGAKLTYAELDASSSRLARWLIARGIGPEDLVALALTRSVTFLTAVWAVAKTGAGYVPVDPDYPADRVTDMVVDSGAAIGLALAATAGLPEAGIEWLRLDDPAVAEEIAVESSEAITDADRVAPLAVDNIAYVIYTSGSTGRPKGVAVTHSGLANFAAEEVRLSRADKFSRVLGFASPSFDASVLEYLLAAVSGGVLAYRPADAVGGEPLAEFMMRQAISHTLLTPSVFATLEPGELPALRVVYAGGEALPQSLKDQWVPFCDVQNAYGPTEATIAVTISDPLEQDAPVVLGGPLAGVGLLVLDDRMRPVGVDVPGELYVCGRALARGYLNRPGISAGQFVANPYGSGSRMYRTGDVVRWRVGEDGVAVLVYAGRSDDQVKLRGLRIELGEIEAVLAEHPQVRSAVVIGVGGSVATALAAYVVSDGVAPEAAELRAFVADRLPAHMVPASVTVLDELPLTPVGKLDKSALPEPVIDVAEYVAPEGPREAAVAAVFGEVLGLDEVSATVSFFDLGGNSLAATRVAARVSEALGGTVSVRDVFESPSVRELTAAVADSAPALPPVTAGPRPDVLPVSFAQQRMWFINQFEPMQPTYNIPIAVRLSGSLDVAALRVAVIDVVERHEVLRTTFPSVDGKPSQLIHDMAWAVGTLDWAVVDSEAELVESASRGFDVLHEPAFRVRLWQQSRDEWIFLAVIHHIAGDGESMRPLIGDVVTAYLSRVAGLAPTFEPLAVQFADYALWQHETLGDPKDPGSVAGAQVAYWTRQLSDLPDVIDLPMDRPRPAQASPAGAAVSFDVPAEIAGRVESLAATHGVSVFMAVHAALAVLLARLSGTDDIAIATPIAGRGDRVLDPLVGMFVNTLVLRTRVAPDMSFDELLGHTRQVDLDAFAHADVPFETVVDAVDPTRSQAFAPLAQVMLVLGYQRQEPEPVDAGGLSVEALDPVAWFAQLDLSVQLNVVAGGDWSGTVTYATALFDAATVESFAARLVMLLDALTAEDGHAIGDAPILRETETVGLIDWSYGVAETMPLRITGDWDFVRTATGPAAQAAAARPGAPTGQ